jgi:hypothetical protein
MFCFDRDLVGIHEKVILPVSRVVPFEFDACSRAHDSSVESVTESGGNCVG